MPGRLAGVTLPASAHHGGASCSEHSDIHGGSAFEGRACLQPSGAPGEWNASSRTASKKLTADVAALHKQLRDHNIMPCRDVPSPAEATPDPLRWGMTLKR